MKKQIILVLAVISLLAMSCNKLKYHVYSIEIRNNTSKELRYVTQVKLGAGQDEYLLPGADTIIYTERRMAKDFDGPSAFLYEYYSEMVVYFTGVSSFVKFSDSADPYNYDSEFDMFSNDNAWNLEIRTNNKVPDGWETENYVYTFSINEENLGFSFVK